MWGVLLWSVSAIQVVATVYKCQSSWTHISDLPPHHPHPHFVFSCFVMVTATDPAFSEKPLHDLEVKDDFEHREMTARGTAESTPDTPDTASADLEYKDEDEQPVLHHRTYIALAALFLLNFTQVIALNGPPAVVSFPRFSRTRANGIAHIPRRGRQRCGTLVVDPNALSLVQAVGGPVIVSWSSPVRRLS